MYHRSKVILISTFCALALLPAELANTAPRKQSAPGATVTGVAPDTLAPLTALECERMGGRTTEDPKCEAYSLRCTIIKPNGDRHSMCVNEAR